MIKNDLSLESVAGLIKGSVAAIVLHGFYPQGLCRSISEKLSKDFRRGFFCREDIKDNEETIDTNQLRKVFHPYQSPLDLLHLVLDKVWPAIHNVEMCQILKSTSPYGIHSLLGPIAANIYLNVPEHREKNRLNLEFKQGDLILFKSKSDYLGFFSTNIS